MSALRCAIVEDEAESRLNIVGYLVCVPDLEVVGVAANGAEAVALIDGTMPDLLLLDIRLPEMDGIEVLRRARHRPEVVFTTAYEAYAVAAFELGALDYLVKPFGRDRLVAAVERVRTRMAAGRHNDAEPAATAVERALATERRPLKRLFARRGDHIVPVAVDEILRASACGEYSEIHTVTETYLVKITLRELLDCLDPETFEQIHRSHIVNMDAVAHLRSADDRRLLVTLRDGAGILASRAGSERLRRRVR